MEALHDILMFLGSSVCHQLTERSITFGDYQMPLCARCMGIHLGFLLSAAFLWAGPLRHASALPSKRALVVLGLFISAGLVDAALSYSGLLPSDNLRRTLSGLAMGTGIPFVLVPLVNMTLFPGRDPRGPLSRPRDWLRLAGVYLFGAAAVLAASLAYAAFVAVSVAVVVGLFVTVSSIFLAILSLALEDRRIGARRLALASVALATSMLLVMAAVHATLLPEL